MPGSNLNLDLPELADPMATIVSKLVTALSAVQDDLAPKIVPSEINVNAALSMNGCALTNTGSVQLVAGNAPSSVGSIYYNTDGEFYAIDATGAVRITLNGALDASSFGGITGMGGTDAAVTYDLSTTQFRFTAEVGEYADLVARYFIMEGNAGTVQMGATANVNTAMQFNIDKMPASGVVPLVYDPSISAVRDGTITSAGGLALFTGILASANITGTNITGQNLTASGAVQVLLHFQHPEWQWALPTFGGSLEGTITGSGNPSSQAHNQVAVSSGLKWYQHLPVRALERVKKVVMDLSASNTGSFVNIIIAKMSATGTLTTVQSAAFSASTSFTITVASPVDAAVGETWLLIVDASNQASSNTTFVTAPTVYIDAVTG